MPGDKSISHRALILGALAAGETSVEGLLESDDVARTADALRALGAVIEKGGDGLWRVHGCGVGALREPACVLDLGNSGTGVRLLMGVAASHAFTSFFTGDASLAARPMQRVAAPLEMMGARIIAREGCRLPLAVVGAPEPMPISYTLPVPSAQAKSAILLAALNAPGTTTVTEPAPTRDHTERMLKHFGAEVEVVGDGSTAIALRGQPELEPRALAIPGDPSSAAFAAVAALAVPGSAVTIAGVGVNPHRIGLYDCLREMGGDITLAPRPPLGGEETADLTIRGGPLEAIEVPAARAPSMIDEFPVLAVAAACAKGTSVLRGLGELRVKESDRLTAIADGLARSGVDVEQSGDDLIIHGVGGRPAGGATIASHLDHRIAMAFLVLGLIARAPVAVDDAATIATSFPGFARLFAAIGADMAPPPP